MSGKGKDYRKGDPLRGAAILLLSRELRGIAGAEAQALIDEALHDLGVEERAARQYLDRHRDELTALLSEKQTG